MFSHQRFFRISYVSNFPNNCKGESLRVTENNNVLKFLGLRSFIYIFKKENNLVLPYKKLVQKQFQRIFNLLSNCLNLICQRSGGPLSEHGGMFPGGYSTKFYTGRLRPEVQPLTLLNTIFERKGTPFIHLLLTNGTPFKNLVYNFSALLIAENALYLHLHFIFFSIQHLLQTLLITENEIILSRRAAHLGRLILCPLVKLYIMTKENGYSIDQDSRTEYAQSIKMHCL